MDEQTIVEQLKQKVAQPTEPSTEVEQPKPAESEQSSFVPDAVSELAMLKLGNELGVINPTSEATKYLQFIYENAAAVAEGNSYDQVAETVNDYLIRLGLKFREDRMMRLYLWMKLNRERLAIEQEMAHVRG